MQLSDVHKHSSVVLWRMRKQSIDLQAFSRIGQGTISAPNRVSIFGCVRRSMHLAMNASLPVKIVLTNQIKITRFALVARVCCLLRN